MPDEPKHTKSAAYAAIWNGSKLLLLGRKKWLSEDTPWIMPGGGRNLNESVVDCLIREVREEIGVRLYEEDFVTQKMTFFKSYETEWTGDLNVFEIELGSAIFHLMDLRSVDFKKFFGIMWLDTSDQQMLNLLWPQLMPGLKMYLKDKLGL